MYSATYEKRSEEANGEARSVSTATTRISRARIALRNVPSAGMSKWSLITSRHVSARIGKSGYWPATWSRPALRMRCCHSGVRWPGRRLGSSRERAAFSRKRAANGADASELADHLAQRGAELDRPARSVSLPERDLSGLSGGRRDDDLRRRDVHDPPRRRPQDKGLAHARLVHHLLVELSDAPPVLRQVHRVQATVGDRAGIGDRQTLRTGAAPNLAGHAIPDQSRAQFDELV